MADFCNQCAREIFGPGISGDFTHFRVEAPLPPGYGFAVLCEGCGPTYVDNQGSCISESCPHHGTKESGDGKS